MLGSVEETLVVVDHGPAAPHLLDGAGHSALLGRGAESKALVAQ